VSVVLRVCLFQLCVHRRFRLLFVLVVATFRTICVCFALPGSGTLNSNRLELLDVPKLKNQLQKLERRTARGGRDSIDHPPGQHDDLANAVAGLASELAKPARRLFAFGGSGNSRIFDGQIVGVPERTVDLYSGSNARFELMVLKGH